MTLPSTEQEKLLCHVNGEKYECGSESDDDLHRSQLRRRRGVFVTTRTTAIGLAFYCITLLGAIFIGSKLPQKHHHVERRAYSPATDALIPVARKFDHGKNPYMGPPGPEVEDAWTRLLQYSNVRFTESELDAIDPQRKSLSSVKLPDGGYFGMLHVFHELHCLKHLRMFVYADHYMPDMNMTQDRRWHLAHCVDALRQGVMCRADVTPRTMRWIDTEPVPGANSSSPHSCFSWNAVDEWAKSRSIENIFDPGYLKHPAFGDVYSWDGFEEISSVGVAHEGHD